VPANGTWVLDDCSPAAGCTGNLAARPPGVEGGATDTSGEAGVPDPETSSPPTLTVVTTDGNPPGSLLLTATFTDYGQFVDPVLRIAPFADLKGKVLTTELHLVSLSNGATTFPGGVQPYVSTSGNNYCYTAGQASDLTALATTWTTVMEDVSSQASAAVCLGGSDPSMVPQIGLHVYSNAASATDPTPFPGPLTVVFEMDNIVAR
jgi:hypothetical protein